MSMKLAYGCTRGLPENVNAAWGGRAIFNRGYVDLPHNRQDLKADNDPTKDALIAWLNSGTLRTAIDAAETKYRLFELDPSKEDIVVLHHDETGMLIASTQGSHGHLYFAGWRHEDVTGDLNNPHLVAAIDRALDSGMIAGAAQ